AAVLTLNGEGRLQGCAVAGTFPPLREVPAQVEQQLLAHPKKHIEFFKEIQIPFTIEQINKACKESGFAFFHKDLPEWLPANFARLAPRLLVSPIRLGSDIAAVVMIVSGDDFDMHKISPENGRNLVRLNEIATLGLKGIRAFRERREHEEKLQNAREEGMLQVSAGIIHNIGNAITVAKLTVHDLSEKNPEEEPQAELFILKELLPKIESEIKDGNAQRFLSQDESGKQYLDAIRELLKHLCDRKKQTATLLKSLKEKLVHISEIIELQQRFVGELGTENMTSLVTVIDSSVKIFEESCNRHGIRLDMQLSEDVPRVLIDPSMMTQVFMNLIKNAVEAIDQHKENKDYFLLIKLYNGAGEEEGLAVAEVIDNGPGIPEEIHEKIFEFGFSTKDKNGISTRGYGLHSCLDTIKKYSGTIKVESDIGEGTTFRILIPIERGKSNPSPQSTGQGDESSAYPENSR
ncbi:MAG: GHKL domain-containing protein, partial [Victivallales bacterium]|nr:GHKL domain-containing protein [Victivallales bacterium]